MTIESRSIALAGVGLCSGLGGYADACAAARAGFARFGGDPGFAFSFPGDDEATPLTVAPCSVNLQHYQGMAHCVKLLEWAWRDFLQNHKTPLKPEGLQVLMAMPDPYDRDLIYEGQEEPVADQASARQAWLDEVTNSLFSNINPMLHNVPVQCVYGDRVAFVRILDKAIALLHEGKASHCLLFAYDSLLSSPHLEFQLESRQLKTEDNPVGYIPGEGAAVFLLTRQAGMPFQVKIALDNAHASDVEDAEQRWALSNLANLVKSVVSKKGQVFPQFYSDINGEEKRAVEFGQLQVKLNSRWRDLQMLTEIIPALSFGETGVMQGPLALLLVVASIQRRYARHLEHLICLSEEGGKRAAIHLEYCSERKV